MKGFINLTKHIDKLNKKHHKLQNFTIFQFNFYCVFCFQLFFTNVFYNSKDLIKVLKNVLSKSIKIMFNLLQTKHCMYAGTDWHNLFGKSITPVFF